MRRLLCLVLVLCLLVPLLPVPSSAAATGAVGTWLLADGAAKIAATLIGIGFSCEVINGVAQSGVFDNLVNTVTTWAKSSGLIDASGKLSVFSRDGKTYIPLSSIDSIASSAAASDYVVPVSYAGTVFPFALYNSSARYDSFTVASASAPVELGLFRSNGWGYYVLFSFQPFKLKESSSSIVRDSVSGLYYYSCSCSNSKDLPKYPVIDGVVTIQDFLLRMVPYAKPGQYVGVDGLSTSSNVLTSSGSLADAFPAWASGAITVPKPGTTGETEEDKIPVWPIGDWNYKPGSTSKPVTQEVIWGIEFEEETTPPSEPTAPTSPIVVPPDIPGLDSEMNFFQRVLNSLETIAQHITNFVTAKWQEFLNWLHSMWDNLLQYCADMKQALEWIYQKIQEFGFRISETLELIPVKITEFLTEFQTWVQAAKDHLSGIRVGIRDIGGGIINLPGNIASAFEGFFEKSDVDLEDEELREELKFDLTEFFPFCIPYDIYDMFAVLNADPVAPSFDIAIPVYGNLVTYHVDLSFLDGLASLIRTFEVLGFAIALGLLTRDKFIRG